jgi:DNA-binding response OmpR family regulator
MILLAEDDPDMRELLAWSLRDVGYEVVEVPDGAALRGLLEERSRAGPVRPLDLVVSDIRMPGENGLSVIQSFRGLPKTTPIILITAFGDRDVHSRCDELGILLLDKPFEIDHLLSEIRRLLSV